MIKINNKIYFKTNVPSYHIEIVIILALIYYTKSKNVYKYFYSNFGKSNSIEWPAGTTKQLLNNRIHIVISIFV